MGLVGWISRVSGLAAASWVSGVVVCDSLALDQLCLQGLLSAVDRSHYRGHYPCLNATVFVGCPTQIGQCSQLDCDLVDCTVCISSHSHTDLFCVHFPGIYHILVHAFLSSDLGVNHSALKLAKVHE